VSVYVQREEFKEGVKVYEHEQKYISLIEA
jgi:hypothetical protein